MAPKFTTPCFIRKNTPELRKKLEELGYKLNNGKWMGQYLATFYLNESNEWKFVGTPKWDLKNHPSFDRAIDCGTNETLFLAIAACRKDSHKYQWHICTRNRITHQMHEYFPGDWNMCVHDEISRDACWRKATVQELIHHFI